jgi:hypothetical protein
LYPFRSAIRGIVAEERSNFGKGLKTYFKNKKTGPKASLRNINWPNPNGFEEVLRKIGDVFAQARFIPRGRILVDQALVNRFIDQRDGWREQLTAGVLVRACDRTSKLLYLCAQLASVTSIDLITFRGLPHSF